MKSRWDDIESWSGYATAQAVVSGPDPAEPKYSTITTAVHASSAVELKKKPDEGPFFWYGTQTTTAFYRFIGKAVPPMVDGFSLVTDSQSGTTDGPSQLSMTTDQGGTPVSFDLSNGAAHINGEGVAITSQGIPAPGTYNSSSYPTGSSVGRPGVDSARLPANGTTLRGSKKISMFIGPGTLAWNLSPSPTCVARQVRLWINAFIPRAFNSKGGVRYLPPFSANPNAGKSVVGLPLAAGDADQFFALTDQREFSILQETSARMKSLIVVDIEDGDALPVHSTSKSIVVDGKNQVHCDFKPATTNMKFSKVVSVDEPGGGRSFSFDVSAAIKNPCWFNVANDLSYEGDIKIEVDAARRTVSLTYNIQLQAFPAFEMYVIVNNGPAAIVFTKMPEDGAAFEDLTAEPSIPLVGEVSVPCVVPFQ